MLSPPGEWRRETVSDAHHRSSCSLLAATGAARRPGRSGDAVYILAGARGFLAGAATASLGPGQCLGLPPKRGVGESPRAVAGRRRGVRCGVGDHFTQGNRHDESSYRAGHRRHPWHRPGLARRRRPPAGVWASPAMRATTFLDVCCAATWPILRKPPRRCADCSESAVDALVNNAGIALPQSLENLDLAALQQVFDLNVRVAVQLAQACLPGSSVRRRAASSTCAAGRSTAPANAPPTPRRRARWSG